MIQILNYNCFIILTWILGGCRNLIWNASFKEGKKFTIKSFSMFQMQVWKTADWLESGTQVKGSYYTLWQRTFTLCSFPLKCTGLINVRWKPMLQTWSLSDVPMKDAFPQIKKKMIHLMISYFNASKRQETLVS